MEATGTERILAADVLVRVISHEDAAAVAELSRQLGYEVSVEMVTEQVGRLSSCAGSQIAFVACVGEYVVGWIEAAITHHLQYTPYALIGGLVVREGMRGLGIGKRLCTEVETWSKEKGVAVVRVTSRSTREDAHRFYLRDGYERIKTSTVFEKILA
jgi:GNAT superfamily N-acetyltransferase